MRMGDVQRFDINNDNQPRFTLSQLGQHERSQHPVSFVISMTRSSGAVTENTKNLFSHHAELAEAFCLIFQSGETELLHSRMEAAGIGRLILLAKVHTIGSAQIQAPDYTEGINVFGLREFCSLLPELPKNSVITLAISHPENMPTVVPRLLVDLMQRVFYRTGIANQDILLSAMGWHIQGKPSGVPHDPVEISLQDLINEIEAEEPQLFEVAKRVQGEGSSSLNPLSRFIYAMYNAYSVRRKCEAVQGRSHYTSSKVPVIQKRDSGIVPILCDARFFVDMRSHTEMAPQDSLHRAIAEWRLCTTSESRAQRKHALSRSIAKLVAGAPVMVPKRTTATITYPIRWFKTVIQRDGTAVNKYLLPVQIKLQNNLGDVLLPLEHYFVRTIAQTIIESDTDDVPQNIFDYCVVAPNSQATLKHLMVQINEVEKGFARRSPVTKGHVEITFTRTFQPKHELKHSFDVIGVPSVLGPIPTGQQTYAAFVSSQTGLSKVYLWEAPGRNGLYVSKYAYTPLKIRIHARPGTVALPAASNLQGNDVISLSSGCPSSTATTAKFKIKVLKNRNVDEVSCAEIHANNAFAMEELDDEQRPTGHYWGAKGEQAHPTQFSSHPSVFSAPESDDPCGRNIVRIFTEFLPAQCIWRLVEVASDEISLQSE